MYGRAILTAGLTMALATASAHQAPGSIDAERERLDRRQQEFFAALAERDADRTTELFSDEAIVHVAGRPAIEGHRAIREFYRNLFGFLSASGAEPEATHVSAEGDMAYGTGRTSNEFRGPQGIVEYTGKYVLIWRKLAGEWRIVFYGVSSNQPDAGR